MSFEIFDYTKKVVLDEMKDTPIVSITRVVDDDTGIWANDEFEFALHDDYRKTYQKNDVSRKRLADELRKVADMIEKDKP